MELFVPGGAFFDRLLQPLSYRKKIPDLFKNKKFRLAVLVAFFSYVIVAVARSPYTFEHVGYVFWMACTITTILALVVGMIFGHRAWCVFCPVATIISALSNDRDQIIIDKNLCGSCGECEKACPMDIKILKYRDDVILSDPDCIKCRECISACPKGALDI